MKGIMTNQKLGSLAVQLKSLGQALGIRNRTLRYVVDNDLVPGLNGEGQGPFVPREFTEEEAGLIAVAAVMHTHGFRGSAVTEIVRKAAPQLREGKNIITVDFRDGFPVQVRLTVGTLLKQVRNRK